MSWTATAWPPMPAALGLSMNQLSKQLLASALVGFVYFYAVKVLWAYLPNINPITKLLFSCCTSEPWFALVVHAHDVAVNILLCIPLAIFLVKLKSEKLWLCALLAVIPNFAYGIYHLFQPEYSGWNISNFAFGWSVELLCLPIALALLFIKDGRKKT